MKIKTLVEFSGVPKGTTGIAERDYDYKEKMYVVTWDLPNFRNEITKKPIQDWFDQQEFDKYLEVIN